MKYKQFFQGIFACAGLFILILDGKTALEGARTGIALCLQVVIPSLFPFFLMTSLLTNALTGTNLPMLRTLGRLFNMPPGTQSILLSGFLGGYPAGAQSIYAVHRSGRISDEDAARLLGFCNNAGPAFLFGMVSQAFPEKWYSWALWGIHILSAWLVSRILPAVHESKPSVKTQTANLTLSSALQISLRGMSTVCGWIVLFRVLIAFLERWLFWLLPKEVCVFFTGLLELSNGCCELSSVENLQLRFVICSVLLAFGGLCVTMQTLSAVGSLSMKFYFQGKALQALFSFLLSDGLIYQIYPLMAASLLFLGFLLRKGQKNSSIIAPIHV